MLQTLDIQKRKALEDLALETNEALETAGQSGATRGFNVGCSMSLVPAGILVFLVFVFGRGNWVLALVFGMLAGLAIAVFANYAAYQAKKRSIEQTYETEVRALIQDKLTELDVDPQFFNAVVEDALPEKATLRQFVTPLPHDESHEEGKNDRSNEKETK